MKAIKCIWKALFIVLCAYCKVCDHVWALGIEGVSRIRYFGITDFEKGRPRGRRYNSCYAVHLSYHLEQLH